MKQVPHERLALIKCGFIVLFFEGQWSSWKFFRKCALLLHWWPEIAKTIKGAKPGSFYHIPCNWAEDGKLRKVPNKDPRLLRMERKQNIARRRRPKKASPPPVSHGPLFDFVKPATVASDSKDESTDEDSGSG